MASDINVNQPAAGSNLVSEPIRQNFQIAANEIVELQDRITTLETTTPGVTNFLSLAGGNMTGPLTLHADGTANLQAVTVRQLNQLRDRITTLEIATPGAGTFLPLAGGTLTGPLTLNANATANLHAVPRQQLIASLADYLSLTGGTLTGFLTGAAASFQSNATTVPAILATSTGLTAPAIEVTGSTYAIAAHGGIWLDKGTGTGLYVRTANATIGGIGINVTIDGSPGTAYKASSPHQVNYAIDVERSSPDISTRFSVQHSGATTINYDGVDNALDINTAGGTGNSLRIRSGATNHFTVDSDGVTLASNLVAGAVPLSGAVAQFPGTPLRIAGGTPFPTVYIRGYTTGTDQIVYITDNNNNPVFSILGNRCVSVGNNNLSGMAVGSLATQGDIRSLHGSFTSNDANSALDINNTGTGNSLQIRNAATNHFVIDNDGGVTANRGITVSGGGSGSTGNITIVKGTNPGLYVRSANAGEGGRGIFVGIDGTPGTGIYIGSPHQNNVAIVVQRWTPDTTARLQVKHSGATEITYDDNAIALDINNVSASGSSLRIHSDATNHFVVGSNGAITLSAQAIASLKTALGI